MMQYNWLLRLRDVINGHQLWNVRCRIELPQSHGRQRWCFVSEDKLWGFSEIRTLRLEFTEVLVRSCEGSNVLTSCVYGLLRARRSGKVIELWRCWTAVIQICGASCKRWGGRTKRLADNNSCLHRGGTAVYTTIRLSVVSTETTILQLYQSRRNQAHSTAVASSAEGRSSLSACHPEIWTLNSKGKHSWSISWEGGVIKLVA